MASVPNDPDAFFNQWLPERFAAHSAELAGKNSPGAVLFRVGDRAPYAVRLEAGQVVCTSGPVDDAIVEVTLRDADFEPVLVRGAEAFDGHGSDRPLAVLGALTLDAERVALIRNVQGSVEFVLTEEDREHKLLLTPAGAAASPSPASCTVRCALEDFLAMQRGQQNPFELMMNGKIQIAGDAQVPMALSMLLA